MKQYEINAPNEYLEEIVKDLGEALGITIDLEELEDVFERVLENKWFSEVFIARDTKDPRSFILVELRNNDYIYGFVIRCNESNFLQGKETLLKWDQFCRKEYCQPEIPDDLEDVFLYENNMLNNIISTYALDQNDFK